MKTALILAVVTAVGGAQMDRMLVPFALGLALIIALGGVLVRDLAQVSHGPTHPAPRHAAVRRPGRIRRAYAALRDLAEVLWAADWADMALIPIALAFALADDAVAALRRWQYPTPEWEAGELLDLLAEPETPELAPPPMRVSSVAGYIARGQARVVAAGAGR